MYQSINRVLPSDMSIIDNNIEAINNLNSMIKMYKNIILVDF